MFAGALRGLSRRKKLRHYSDFVKESNTNDLIVTNISTCQSSLSCRHTYISIVFVILFLFSALDITHTHTHTHAVLSADLKGQIQIHKNVAVSVINGRVDSIIQQHKIVESEAGAASLMATLPHSHCRRVLDAKGALVTPG